MSVLIKGMEMPECCDECVFMEIQDNGFGNDYICSISKEDVDGVCDCPLIEIPDDHGRLIDADALLDKQVSDAKIFEGSTFYDDKVRYDEATNAVANIINARTVIPSDKDGET